MMSSIEALPENRQACITQRNSLILKKNYRPTMTDKRRPYSSVIVDGLAQTLARHVTCGGLW